MFLNSKSPDNLRPIFDRGPKLGRFETLSWQIDAGHFITLDVLNHNRDFNYITEDQYQKLLKKLQEK